MLGFKHSTLFVILVASALSAPQQGVPNVQDFTECGRTVDNLDGSPVEGEFPYFCSLFVKKDRENIFIGGATLVSENVLLSLATLFTNLRLIDVEGDCNTFTLKHDVFASCGNINLKAEPASRQDKLIQKVYIHPEHSNSSLINDYALLITEPFTYTNQVGRVCLPFEDIEESGAFDATKCITLGHGQDKYEIYNNNLQKSSPGLVGRQDCEDKLNQGHFIDNGIDSWKLHDTHICAGDGKADTCKGDGGGPLLCQYDYLFEETSDFTSYFQVGVTAWGPKSCTDDDNTLPSVYSRVSRVIPWIKKTVGCNPVTYDCTNIAEASDFDLRTTQQVNGCKPVPKIAGVPDFDLRKAGALDFDIRTSDAPQDCTCSTVAVTVAATVDDVDIREAGTSDFDIRTVD